MASKTIGLCLSGGGHRASIFSLGALLYLVDADRHGDVKAISSVSGGSLTSGFLAVQPKPLHQMNRAEFDACAARWAHQIAGSPAWWRAIMAMWAVFLLAWLLLVCAGWGWSPRLARFISPPWWETQLFYLAAVCVWARIVGSRPGGTFWGWWGTWLYLGVVGPACLLSILVWWSPLSWWWRIPTAFLVVLAFGYAFALRSRVADHAFRATVTERRELREIPPAPRHVFCSTEMQTGKYAYFSRDFIYSDGAGLGQPADLLLSTALQVSANFPVAFPYRIIPLKKHDFQLGMSPEFRKKKSLASSLVLSDGGVRDNTGIAWFWEASERNARLKWFLDSVGSGDINSPFGQDSLPEKVRERIEERLAAMGDSPDLWVVVNSSVPNAWSEARLRSIPIFGEGAGLLRVEAVIYGNRGSEQSRLLQRRFFDGSLTGAMVSIEQHPNWIYHFLDLDRSQLELQELGLFKLPATKLEHYRQRAQTAWASDVFGPNAKPELLTVDKRRRELRMRLGQLRAQLERARGLSAEETRLHAEIEECSAELHDVIERIWAAQDPQRAGETWQLLDETTSSSAVPTTFRPLGVRAVADLLRHGYLSCMKICYLLLEGFPHFADPPSREELQQLARGVPRQRYPTRPQSATAVS